MDAPERIGLIGNGLGQWGLATQDEAMLAVHYVRAAEHDRIVADYLAVIDHLHHEHDYWRGRAEFAEAQFEALAEMAPPPQKGLLLRRLKELAEIRALKGGKE